jgi:hypothetical protein
MYELINAGADLDAIDEDSRAALQIAVAGARTSGAADVAVENSMSEIIRYLVFKGALTAY